MFCRISDNSDAWSAGRSVTGAGSGKLTDLITGEQISSDGKTSSMIWGWEREEKIYFDIVLKPHSYRVFETE